MVQPRVNDSLRNGDQLLHWELESQYELVLTYSCLPHCRLASSPCIDKKGNSRTWGHFICYCSSHQCFSPLLSHLIRASILNSCLGGGILHPMELFHDTSPPHLYKTSQSQHAKSFINALLLWAIASIESLPQELRAKAKAAMAEHCSLVPKGMKHFTVGVGGNNFWKGREEAEETIQDCSKAGKRW